MVDITIVNGVYKPTYTWGAPSCNHIVDFISYVLCTIQYHITARRYVLPGKFTWRLSIILQHAQTISNTCAGPVF